VVETASIDEAYLDATGLERAPDAAANAATLPEADPSYQPSSEF
jgi:nucleotidyltransferase/DNA polymerase involved in DNA repair